MCRKLIYLVSFLVVLSATGNASADLVAHWRFDEGSGTTAYDTSGNGYDGTLNGDATWAAGQLGGALQLDGSGDYVNCGLINIDTAVTGGLTVCAWINKPAGGDMKYCSNRQGDNAAGGGFTCTIYNNRMEMDFTNATARNLNRDTDGPTVPANTWVHVAWVYDDAANTFNEYHDGVLADSSTENVSIGVSTQEFRIGADAPNLGRYVNGLIDDLRIYDYALSEQELLGVMQGGGVSYPFASRPIPADGAMNAAIWASCQWTPGDSAVSHDVYFGESFDDVNDGTGDTFRGNYTDTSFVAGFIGCPYPDGLVPGTTYYWRIDEVNDADPNSPWKGDVWSFWVPSKKAYEPNPPDDARFVDPDVTLSWTAGFEAIWHTVYFGDDFDTVNNATDGTTNVLIGYSPGPLEYDKTYYWRVDETDTITTYKGDVWSFRTIPDIAVTDPNLIAWWKLDEGSGNTALDWSGHKHHGNIGGTPQWVPGYDGDALDFDGSTNYIDVDGQLVSGTFSLTMWIRPRDIPYSSGYYAVMHNDAWNAGSVHVHLRANTSLFNAAINSGPGVTSNTVLQEDEWYHCAVTVTNQGGNFSQLYINGVLENTGAGGDGTPYLGPMIFGAWDGGTTRHYHGLMDDIRIYDKVLTGDEVKQVMRGDPMLAWDPSPTNGSIQDIHEATPLSWSPGDKAAQHDVYFGTDKDAVTDADASDTTGIYCGRQAATTYTPPGVEWGGGPYYWRIDEYNTDGTISKGRVWSFTVADFIAIDDFEDYDAGENQIWYAWHDGLGFGAIGTPPYYAGNGTGSAVGDETTASYTEENIVNSGDQSMPYWYDNNKPGYSKYSEAKLTLSYPRDWTKHGVKALSLWFRGYPASVGSFTENPAGTYTMTASGYDIWRTSDGVEIDEFHFAYKTLNGPGTIIAKVDSVQNTNGWAKAGVMIRETLDPNSAHAFACITPSNGVAFQGRPSTGGASFNINQTGITAPHWVRLERDLAGNFTVSHSANGSTWEPVQNALPETIPMNANVYIGLALTAHNAAATCEAVFSNVTISDNVGTQWMHQDIGIQSNDTEPMYVALANSTGPPAVVYHDDPNAAQIDTWTEWNIDLKDFADQGVSLADVNSIAIGFGNRNNPQAGGSGKMYFDDIRLYRPRCLPNLIKPVADFSNNCVVDMADIEIMANDWLISGYDVTVLAASNANLEAHYKFEGNLLDSSGNLHHGDPCGTIAYAAGKIGQAIDFNGAGYVSVAGYQGVAGTQSRTTSAWIKTTTTGEIVSWGQNVAGQKWIFRVQVDNGTEGAIRVEVNGGYIIGDTDVRDAQWHHVAAVLVDDGSPNTTEMELYVDGTLEVISASLDEPINTASDGVVRIGEAPWHNRPFTGQIDDVRIYGRVLSHGEIANLAGMSVGSVLQQPVHPLLSTTNDTDLHDDEKIDLKDFAVLADMWLQEQLWPE